LWYEVNHNILLVLTGVVWFKPQSNLFPSIYSMFSTTIKDLRIAKRLTLREFCKALGLDPSNWSKVERGINPPPSDVNALEALAQFFGLMGEQKQAFFDEAAISRNELPKDLADDELFTQALPAFFRAYRDHKLTEDQLLSLAGDIRKLHQPDRL
jgi:transcriptional regulator with XRE-family HTH domain